MHCEQHPAIRAFEAVGYPRDVLTDPAHITADDIETGEYRIVQYDGHGVMLFDVGGDSITDVPHVNSGAGVKFGSRQAVQPIGFNDPLYDELPDMKTNVRVVFFTNAERDVPTMSKEEAICALKAWGSEGYIPYETAIKMGEPFGRSLIGIHTTDDDDAAGVKLVRAPVVAKRLAAEVHGGPKQSDSDITGHKKRRRQEFYRNLELLDE